MSWKTEPQPAGFEGEDKGSEFCQYLLGPDQRAGDASGISGPVSSMPLWGIMTAGDAPVSAPPNPTDEVRAGLGTGSSTKA